MTAMTQAQADAQQDAIKLIMAEQHLNFGEAVNVYIRSRAPYDRPTIILARQPVDMSGWDAA